MRTGIRDSESELLLRSGGYSNLEGRAVPGIILISNSESESHQTQNT